MNSTKQNFQTNFSNFLLIAAGFSLFKIFVVYFSSMPLWADEAQYWVWSKNLDLGYYSKPPMIAWIIASFTKIFGNSEFAIRLPSGILHFCTAIFVYKIGLKLYDSKTAFYSGLIYIFATGVSFSTQFFSTDALLIFFWALGILFILNALQTNKIIYWLLAGLSVGLGMLSKYTIIIFYPSLFLYFVISKQYRKQLLGFGFWTSGFLAFLTFLPNIIWNLNNGLVSLHHTEDNVLTGGVAFYPLEIIEFLSAQFLVFGIITFFIYVIYLVKNSYKILLLNEPEKFLLCTTLPLFFAGIFISTISGAQAHWIAPIYVFASIQITYFLLNKNKFKLLNTALYLNIIISILFFGFCLSAPFFEKFNIKALNRLLEFNSTSSPIEAALNEYKNSVVLVDERKTAAIFMYNLKDKNGNLPSVYKWNSNTKIEDYFDMKFDFSTQIGKNAILVSRYDISEKEKYFDKITELKTENLPRNFKLYYLQNFKGY